MSRNQLQPGDRIRLKRRLMFSGYKGFGIVIRHYLESVEFYRVDENWNRLHEHDSCSAMRHEVAKLRKQSGVGLQNLQGKL